MTILAKARGLELKAIKSSGGPRGELYVYGDIVSDKWIDEDVTPGDVVNVLNELSALHVSDIDVFINSPGGSVFAGAAIYTALKTHPAAINVQIDGIAASIASVIAMSGDLISISEVGMMMLHDPWSATVGNSTELRKQADVLDKVRDSMLGAYGRSGLSQDKLKAILANETWYTAAEAVSAGFADEVVQTQAVAAQLIKPGRFSNTPAQLLEDPVSNLLVVPAALHDAAAKIITGEELMADPIDIEDKLQEARDAAALEATAKAKADEKERKANIDMLYSQFPHLKDLRNKCVEDSDCIVETANTRLLEALAEGAGPLGGASRVEVIATEHEQFRAGVIDGILQKAGVNERTDDNPFRGFSMRDVARGCVANMGHDVGRMSTEQIVKAALTSESDFPVLYEEAMHKVLLGAFRTAPDTWSEYMASGNLSDFRPHNRYRMGTFGNLPGLQENGEIKHTTLQDGTKEIIQAEERGMIFTLSYKMIVDDDLGSMLNIARQFGRSAKRTVESECYTELLANPTMNDGTALFHADHGNLEASGTAIDIASLGKARATMRRQMDPSSNEYIDLLPSILLCPVELGDLARQIITSETDFRGTKNSKARNPIQNMVRVVDTPRLTGTGWYLFAAPSDTAIGEVGFLNGNTEPQVSMDEAFTTRGVSYRVVYDFGLAMLEYRAGYFNPGA